MKKKALALAGQKALDEFGQEKAHGFAKGHFNHHAQGEEAMKKKASNNSFMLLKQSGEKSTITDFRDEPCSVAESYLGWDQEAGYILSALRPPASIARYQEAIKGYNALLKARRDVKTPGGVQSPFNQHSERLKP